MSNVYVYLSFFKSNKIDYIYHANNNTIEFPCIHCQHSAWISTNTSEWFCYQCHKNGNLINLIEFSKHHSFGKLFIPKKELKNIIQSLDRLSKKYPHEVNLFSLKNRIIHLVNYFNNSRCE